MNVFPVERGSRCIFWAVSLLISAQLTAFGAEVYVTHTDWVERPITNVIEVRMPKNVFIVQYHTNWVTDYRTNVVSLFQTNRAQFLVTNRSVVNLVQTNFVQAYQTNLRTFTLTNWETVLVLKTNWLSRQVTNFAQIDVPAPMPAKASSASSSLGSVQPAANVAGDGLVMEPAKPPRRVGDNQLEIRLRVRAADESLTPIVQRWRIERVDGAILGFSQEQQLNRELLPGEYKVEAHVQRQSSGPVIVLRALLTVTTSQASLKPAPNNHFASASVP